MTIDNHGNARDSFFAMVTGGKDIDAGVGENAGDINAAEDVKRAEDSLPVEDPSSLPASAESADMPHDARRVLVHLMRQGVIIAAQKPKLFELVCRYQTWVRRHLAEVYLQLVLDNKSGVAFVATSQSSDGNDAAVSIEANDDTDDADDEFVTLIAIRPLSLYDTLILLVLRKHYQERESAGEQKITIDIERLESYLTPFLSLTDHASLDRKKLLARVKEMVHRKVLSTIRGSEHRYEITPIIRYVVSANFLESMLAEYIQLAADDRQDHSIATHSRGEPTRP